MINIDNITVNGNAYVIDGMKKPVMINVSEDNVKISNLTFVNALNNQNSKSMITWSGDNGVLSSCNLVRNIVVNGGAILNQGYIICHDCYFYNNSAKCGAAVFNAGYFEYEECIFENNHASKKGNDICSVDDAKEQKGDGSLTVMRSDKGIRVINGENITETGEHWYVYVKSESLVKATLISAVTGYVVGAVVGLVVGVCTLNPIAGVAAGAAMGAYTSWYMTTNNYNPELKVWKVYTTVIGISVVAGAIGGAMGGYVGACLEYIEVAAESEVVSEYDAMSEGAMNVMFLLGL